MHAVPLEAEATVMILTGVVERVGGARVRGKYETVDAVEVRGYPEYRTLNGTSYVMDHLRDSVGTDASIAISNHILIAIKQNGRVYAETGFKTIMNSGGKLLVFLLMALLIAGIFGARGAMSAAVIGGPLLFLALYIRIKRMVARVARA